MKNTAAAAAAAAAAGVAAGVAWDTWAAADAAYCNAIIPSKAAKAAADAAWVKYADAIEVAAAEWNAVAGYVFKPNGE